MKPVYILTKEEYDTLRNSEPDIFLAKRVEELEEQLEKYKEYKLMYEKEAEELGKQSLPKATTYENIIVEYFVMLRELDFKKVEAYEIIGKKYGKSSSTIGKIVRNSNN
jgi:hypothetical protein